jgi:Uma2 family endonuclease
VGDALTKKKYLTREEYFTLSETANDKLEFENGEVFAMSGGSFNHGLICNNVGRRLAELVDHKNCTAVGSDVKVEIATAESYVYPDAMVICGPIEFTQNRNDSVKNPVLVVEVLSDSTESYDRGKKFKKYQSLPSFREYILISQTEPLVETFFRQDENRWIYTITQGEDAVLSLSSMEGVITLNEIYRKVDWAAIAE